MEKIFQDSVFNLRLEIIFLLSFSIFYLSQKITFNYRDGNSNEEASDYKTCFFQILTYLFVCNIVIVLKMSFIRI